MNRYHGVVVLVGLLLLAGCAAPVAAPRDGGAPRDPERVMVPTPTPAVVALQDQAEQASGVGEHERAAALLERALHIEPRNPALWYNLAVVRYRLGECSQAEGMAQRSLQLGAEHRKLARQNWELIAVCRELAGDAIGAREARDRASAWARGVSR